MKRERLLLAAPGRLERVVDELPAPGAGELLVRSVAGTLSVGEEFALFAGRVRPAPALPLPLGRETLAEVVAAGGGVEGFAPGDRLVAALGHATGGIVRADAGVPVPAGAGEREALLCVPAADVRRAVGKARLRPRERVLVTGAGAFGLLLLCHLRLTGRPHVAVAEPLADRRGVALALGAEAAYAPGDPALPEGAFAAGFECSGEPEALLLLQRALAPGGRIVVASGAVDRPAWLDPGFRAKELTLAGSAEAGAEERRRAGAALFNAIANGARGLADIYDVELSFDGLPGLFAGMAAGGARPRKPLVRYPA